MTHFASCSRSSSVGGGGVVATSPCAAPSRYSSIQRSASAAVHVVALRQLVEGDRVYRQLEAVVDRRQSTRVGTINTPLVVELVL